MNCVLLLVKSSLKQFWDVDPYVVDNLLLNAKLLVVAGCHGAMPGIAKTLRNAVCGITAEFQSLTTLG